MKFRLPDNVTDYRIITIGQAKTSQFAVTESTIAEKTIQVRKDYTIETHVPYMAYSGDTIQAIATVANATKKITSAEFTYVFGSGSEEYTVKKSIIIQPFSSTKVDITVPVRANWQGDIPYTATVIEKNQVLDSVTHTIRIAKIPLIEAISRQSGMLSGSLSSLDLTPITRDVDAQKSHIVLRVSRGLLRDPGATIASLIQYPY